MKLRIKVLLKIIVPIFITFTLLVGYLFNFLYTVQEKTALNEIQIISKNYSGHIKEKLDIALATANNISNISLGFIKSNNANRQVLDDILKEILQNNTQICGVWVGFEPYVFDGKDFEFQNISENNTGRVVPYWHRNDGDLYKEYLENCDTYEYYKKTF